MGRKIYLAGPMSGIPEFNFPAFFAAQAVLEQYGWQVFNPAQKDMEKTLDSRAMETGDAIRAVEKGFNFREAFLWDITRIMESDAIYMLNGWEQSSGARAEHATAALVQKRYPDFQILYQNMGTL